MTERERRGKYTHVPTSADDFAERKHQCAQCEQLRRERDEAQSEHDEALLDAAKLRAERDEARAALARITMWTCQYGAQLCPPSNRADSYGDGMRDAKDVVARLMEPCVKTIIVE